MKLYYTQNSPYARIARIALRESGLTSDVPELLALNREQNNPVLQYSPVGRVPTLVDGDVVITEAKNICNYFFARSNQPNGQGDCSNDIAAICQEGQILGYLDGIACWVREKRREPKARSEFLLQVEFDRSLRCLEYMENEAKSERLVNFPAFRSLALAAGLSLMDYHAFHPRWREVYASLSAWFEQQEVRPSMQETIPQ